jgi:ferredoxin
MTLYRIELDGSLCVGYGSCAQLAPEIFVLADEIATTRAGTSDDPAVLEAADLCPMSAITVVREPAA